MVDLFSRWARSLRGLSPLFALLTLGGLVAAGMSLLPERFDDWLYPGILALLWGLTGLCFLFWFRPPPPTAELLTTRMGRFKVRVKRFFMAAKCWVFVLMFGGVVFLSVRFVMLWW